MRTAAVAAVAFGMGALAATAVLAIQENASEAPVLAAESPAPGPVEAVAEPLQAPQAADVASERASGDEPGLIPPQRLRAVAVGPDDAPPPRPVRDVTVEPNVDPSALPQDRSRLAEGIVRPALEARRADERAAPEPAPEPLVADRQDVGMAVRPDMRPSLDAPTEEIIALAPAEPSSDIPPALTAAPGESAAAPASARVKSAVSMRSGPDKGTEVVGVVPADGPVQVVACDGWCEVIYNGQRGFIYRTFLDGAS